MATIKLRNKYKFSSRVGALVRVDPKNPTFFEYVVVNTLPVIGSIVDSRGYNQPVTISLLGQSGSSGDGASAYEVAVENGYKGTVQQWLASLKGADGKAGDDGHTPVKGVDYFDGLPGENGAIGPQGPHGIQGPKGDVGAKGDKGDVGPQGLAGADGAQGPQGNPGTPGAKGDKGDAGAQGPMGLSGSDATVTKTAVESVLTGEISSHSHASSGGLTQAQILTRQL